MNNTDNGNGSSEIRSYAIRPATGRLVQFTGRMIGRGDNQAASRGKWLEVILYATVSGDGGPPLFVAERRAMAGGRRSNPRIYVDAADSPEGLISLLVRPDYHRDDGDFLHPAIRDAALMAAAADARFEAAVCESAAGLARRSVSAGAAGNTSNDS